MRSVLTVFAFIFTLCRPCWFPPPLPTRVSPLCFPGYSTVSGRTGPGTTGIKSTDGVKRFNSWWLPTEMNLNWGMQHLNYLGYCSCFLQPLAIAPHFPGSIGFKASPHDGNMRWSHQAGTPHKGGNLSFAQLSSSFKYMCMYDHLRWCLLAARNC